MTSAIEYRDRPVLVPESLLKHPCEPVGAGSTVGSLSTAYVKNVRCIGDYKSVVEGISEYNNRMKDVANGRAEQESK